MPIIRNPIQASSYMVDLLNSTNAEEARNFLNLPDFADYQILSEKDQAGGYAALNAQRQVDVARIPSAPRWTTPRTLTLTGDATGSVSLDGSANATLTVNVSSGIATALIQDRKPALTQGGTFTAGAWRTRDLNTIAHSSIPGISLASNQFVLPAGKFSIFCITPASVVSRHQSRLFNVSLNAAALNINGVEIYSMKAVADAQYLVSGHTVFFDTILLTGSSTFRIEHYCENTRANSGFGVGDVFTTSPPFQTSPSIFTQVLILKI